MSIAWASGSAVFSLRFSETFRLCCPAFTRAEEHVLLERPMTASWSSELPYGFPGSPTHTPGFDKDFSNRPAVRVISPYPEFTALPSTTIGSVTPYYASLCLTSARKPVPEDSLTLLHRLEVRIEAFSWPSSCRPRSGTMDKLLPVLCWIRYHRNPSVPRPRRRRSRPAPQDFVFLVRTATSSAHEDVLQRAG
ncbi:hypothetical protein FA13DRAFT_341048 [Coprinellus micaceus]|uniref:Uncharacterized protein n=1 Tax=Coprinellus micaceus TaxID=71717 RepID=A0A4Y7TC27_COPMI|nr:hypothetical protein FA13DRAFT_341048 [Coprinellus micaceus]